MISEKIRQDLIEKLEEYLRHPRSHHEIIHLRNELITHALPYFHITPTSIQCNNLLSVIRKLCITLFGERISRSILAHFTVGNDTTIPTFGVFQPEHLHIALNPTLLRSLVKAVSGVRSFPNSQYRSDASPLEKMILVVEHEFVHFLLYQAEAILPTPHSPFYLQMVRALFGHGWGDFAMTHLGTYLEHKGNKKKFKKVLLSRGQYEEAYVDHVYWVLHRRKYGTMKKSKK
jgi:hypothetical protein